MFTKEQLEMMQKIIGLALDLDVDNIIDFTEEHQWDMYVIQELINDNINSCIE